MKAAVIVPRYGEQIVGGAETLAQSFAEYATQQGWQVTVLTTCAQDHLTWENCFAEGQSELNQVKVIRFPIAPWSSEAHHRINYELSKRFFIPVAEQSRWLATGPHSPELYAYLQTTHAGFDVIFALPYLSTIVQYAAWVAPEKVVMLPCLHEEAHAFMKPLHWLLETVRAVLFLSPEEKAFATDALGLCLQHTAVIGMGINEPPTPLPAIAKPDIPYLLLSSRLEPAKNLAVLYDYVQRYVDEGGHLELQIIGTGSFTPPEHPAFVLRGYLLHEQKLAWAQAALATCQPSLMESFSIVIMESWQMGRPTLVHKDCAVTSGHVQRSAGGFVFDCYNDFADAIDWLQTHPADAKQMGLRGQQYVNNQYRWPIVFEKLINVLSESGIPVSGS